MQTLKIFSFFIHNQYAHISKTKAMFASIEKKRTSYTSNAASYESVFNLGISFMKTHLTFMCALPVFLLFTGLFLSRASPYSFSFSVFLNPFP